MQKFICTALTILLICISTKINATFFYTNYNNIKMTEQEYNNLLELGFSKNEIYQMNKKEFINNKNLKASLISETEQYYKTTTLTKNGISFSESEIINKKQYKTENTNKRLVINSNYNGIVETEYKNMRTSIIKLDEYQYRYKITLTWLKIPSTRSYDIIAIGFQPAYVKINSSIYAQQNYTYSNGTNSSSITCIPIESKNGGSAIIKLPTGNISTLSSYLYFNVKKANDNNLVTHMEAGGDYSHATNNINAAKALKHSVNHSSGIELNKSIKKYYDGINIATASWYGTW